MVGEEGLVEQLVQGKYKYGRSGTHWDINYMKNGTVGGTFRCLSATLPLPFTAFPLHFPAFPLSFRCRSLPVAAFSLQMVDCPRRSW